MFAGHRIEAFTDKGAIKRNLLPNADVGKYLATLPKCEIVDIYRLDKISKGKGEVKTCAKCHVLKSTDDFYWAKNRHGERVPNGFCKQCRSIINQESYAKLKKGGSV